jgi:hypothetical protein
MSKNRGLSLLCLPLLALQLLAADGPVPKAAADSAATAAAAAPPATSDSGAATVDDLKKLRDQIAKQQEEIKRLQQSVEEQQKALDRAVAAVSAAPAPTPVGAPAKTVNTANADGPVNVVPAVNGGWHLGGQHNVAAPASPLGISIGTTTFTPLGFMDATFFWRSTNVGSGIGTNFFGVPYNSAVAGKLSETNFSAQNSRIGFRVDSTVMGAQVLGYLETDFLFNNDANSFQVTSNSAGLRLRNYFVDVQKGKFELLGGQDWSMLTPNRKGLSPIPSDIFYTQNMDTNYQLGLTWTRAPQFRFIYHANDNFAIGLALENPQQYIGGGSGASTVVLPNNLATTLAGEFNSGQTPTAVPNVGPDIIMKAAYDGHWGDKLEHVEVAGLVSNFKDYVPQTVTTAVSGTHSATGYGGSVNFNLELIKNFRLIANNYWSQGGGRYLFGQAPDLVVRPDGSISPVHAGGTVDGFEAQVTPNTLFAMYYGGVFVGKNVVYDNTATGSTLAKPVYVGYGYPGSTSVRDGQEITFDWVQTLWKNKNYGALSLINQYSYVFKEPWYIQTGGLRQAHTNMIYVDLRYTLP